MTWALIQRDVIANRTSMIGRIGHLVTVEVEQLAAGQVTGSPSGRHRCSPGEGDPVPHRPFLRVDVDDDTWTALRVAATDIGITVTRYLGELVWVRILSRSYPFRTHATRRPTQRSGPA